MTYTSALPRILQTGAGASAQFPQILASLGCQRPLIITDGMMVQLGYAERIRSALAEAGLPCDVFADTVPESTVASIQSGVATAREGRYDSIVALGGGSPIDSAKAIGILAKHGGEMRDYKFPRNVTEAGLPIIAIPTTAGTGSEVTRFAIITDETSDEKMLYVGPAFMPVAALVDYELTLSLPPRVTADTGIDALVMGAGQFCTNPGIVLAVDGPDLEAFLDKAGAHLGDKAAQTMLTPGIHSAYSQGIDRITSQSCVQAVASGQPDLEATQAQGHLYQTTFESVAANAQLLEEVFGPAAIVIRCQNVNELLAFAKSIEGQLTATLHLEDEDLTIAQGLVQAMEKKAGRVLVNGFPTGVEVCDSMVHGGAFPATSDSRTTSVGSTAIDRFLRPVCYQNLPNVLLPDALKQNNPLNIWRLVDGKTTARKG